MAKPLPNDLQLRAYIRNQRVLDADLRKLLFQTANDAKRRVARMEVEHPGSVRAVQLQLQEQQLRLWANVGYTTEDGIVRNGRLVAETNKLVTDEFLMSKLGIKSGEQMRRSLQAQAENTINNYLARQHHGFTLSERVYRNGQVASGRIDNIIDRGILRGASARELARDVAGFINPSTPGGVSYAAMRLGRTELNNSFHQAAIESAVANPFVEKMRWSLSGSHPRPDACDDLVGTYPVDEVPDKPHPQCLCYLEPMAISKAALVRNFRAGRYDQWASEMLSSAI